MNKFLCIFTVLASLFSSTLCSANDLSVSNAWIREAPPVSKVQAAYMELYNNTDKTISLIAANSPAFSKIEFHRTEMNNGMMRMLQEESLRIPAQGKTSLQPDGTHMMLFNPVKALKSGDKVNFTLTFSNQKEIEVVWDEKPVKLVLRSLTYGEYKKIRRKSIVTKEDGGI